MTRIVAVLALAAASAWTGCASSPAPAPSSGPPPAAAAKPARAPDPERPVVSYTCAGGRTFSARFNPSGRSVVVSGLPGGKDLTLHAAPAASGAKYVRGSLVLWTKPGGAFVERKGKKIRSDCTVVADPGSLTGSAWRLAVLAGAGATPSAPEDPSRYTIVFGSDGLLVGQADCNRLRGPFKAEPAALALGPLATTKMLCPPGSLFDAFVAGLDAVKSWEMQGSRLVLRTADGGSLTFDRAD